jgi:hypothetical protein
MPRSVVNAYVKRSRQPGEDALRRIAAAAGFDLELVLRKPPGRLARAAWQLRDSLGDELVEKLLAIDGGLAAAGLRHAFGGSIALAYCTKEPRATRDLDLNVFVEPSQARDALSALPRDIEVTSTDVEAAAAEGQRRLWWGDTPVDLFFDTLALHGEMAGRVLWAPLAGRAIPVVDGASLVVFKALIDRTRDWVDIEAVAEYSLKDVETAAQMLLGVLNEDDPRHARLDSQVRRDPV